MTDGLSIEQVQLCKDIKNSCKFLNVACLIACKSTKMAIVLVYRSSSVCPNGWLVEITDMFSQVL